METFTYLTYKVLTETPLKEQPSLNSRTFAMIPKNRLFFVLKEDGDWLTTAYGYVQSKDCEFAFSYEEELD